MNFQLNPYVFKNPFINEKGQIIFILSFLGLSSHHKVK